MSLKQEIQQRLNSLGVVPKQSLGQNFLIDESVVSHIIKEVISHQPEALVEVGPGVGALTFSLMKLGSPLTLIELDRKFAKLWEDEFQLVAQADALQLDWRSLDLPYKTLLVSNLPYQISSSLIVERSLGPSQVVTMVLMLQKEVAQRIMALPRSKEYGLLSVIAQLYWVVHKVCEVGPGCFWPKPKVASRVLAFKRREEAPQIYGKELLGFIKAAFSHRRKILWKNLAGEYGYFGINRDFAQKIGMDFGLEPQVRAEELEPEQFVQLFEAFRSVGIGRYS